MPAYPAKLSKSSVTSHRVGYNGGRLVVAKDAMDLHDEQTAVSAIKGIPLPPPLLLIMNEHR
jgi:hypothetical protein